MDVEFNFLQSLYLTANICDMNLYEAHLIDVQFVWYHVAGFEILNSSKD